MTKKYSPNEISKITSNTTLMSGYYDIRLSLDGTDKLHFMNIAVESSLDQSTQATILNKLYNETKIIQDIDTVKISSSKGNVTKYKHFDQMYNAMELLKDSMDGDIGNGSLKIAYDLYNKLLTHRADFEFGYATNNYIITGMYEVLVLSLHELINYASTDATAYIRKEFKMPPGTLPKSSLVEEQIKRYLTMVNSGQWKKMVDYFRKDARNNNFAMESITLSGFLASAIGGGVVIVGIIIAILLIMRGLIYWFYLSANNINTIVKSNAELLSLDITNDSNSVGIEKRKKLLSKLSSISDFIEYRVFKSSKTAKENISKANKATFSPSEIRQVSSFDFEI